MEMQKWDKPQCFDYQNNNNTQSDDVRISTQKYNGIYDNSSHKKLRNINSEHKMHNYYQHKQNNATHHMYNQSNDNHDHNYNNRTYHYQRKYKNDSNNTKYYKYNKNNNTNVYYIKKNSNDHKQSNNCNQHRIHHEYNREHDQKTNKINDIDIAERNTSNGTILYCPWYANKSRDIIKIKPDELIPLKAKGCIRIITFGCTHELHNHVLLPNGDLLINAGDTCNWRRYHHTQKIYATAYDTWKDFVSLLNKTRNKKADNYKYGIYVIPGNHDIFVEQNTNEIHHLLSENNLQLLINQSATINVSGKTFSIFGSPISWFRSKPSNAYQIHRKRFAYLWNTDNRMTCHKHWDYDYIKNKFHGSDILVCHGPCAGFGDCEVYGKGTGSYELLKYIKKQRPKLFICCDFHGSGKGTHGYGVTFLRFKPNYNQSRNRGDFCICMNVAIAHQCARHMRAENVKRGVTMLDVKIEDLI